MSDADRARQEAENRAADRAAAEKATADKAAAAKLETRTPKAKSKGFFGTLFGALDSDRTTKIDHRASLTSSRDVNAPRSPLEQDFGENVRAGWLLKLGTGRNRKFQKRYCLLRDGFLYYYHHKPKSDNEYTAKNIRLEGYVPMVEGSLKGQCVLFKLVHPSKPAHQFITDSEAILSEWVKALHMEMFREVPVVHEAPVSLPGQTVQFEALADIQDVNTWDHDTAFENTLRARREARRTAQQVQDDEEAERINAQLQVLIATKEILKQGLATAKGDEKREFERQLEAVRESLVTLVDGRDEDRASELLSPREVHGSPRIAPASPRVEPSPAPLARPSEDSKPDHVAPEVDRSQMSAFQLRKLAEREKAAKEREEREKANNTTNVQQAGEKEKMEKDRLEKEQIEKDNKDKIAKEKLEATNLEKAKKEKLEKEKQEKEKVEKEKQEKEKIEKTKLEKERMEKMERERLEREKMTKEQLEKDRAERLAKEKLNKEKVEREHLEKEKLEREKLEKDRLERAKVEKEKMEKEKIEREKMEKLRLDQEKAVAEKMRVDKEEKEKLNRERLAKEQKEREEKEQKQQLEMKRANIERERKEEAERNNKRALLLSQQQPQNKAGGTKGAVSSIPPNSKVGKLPIHEYPPLAPGTKLTGMPAMLHWAQRATRGFPGVAILNFTKSWQNGLAFAALCANWRPDAIDYWSLDPGDALGNLQKAFKAAEKIGVSMLLDAEDVVDVQDAKSLYTQMTMFHRTLNHQDPAPRPWEGGGGGSVTAEVEVKTIPKEVKNLISLVQSFERRLQELNWRSVEQGDGEALFEDLKSALHKIQHWKVDFADELSATIQLYNRLNKEIPAKVNSCLAEIQAKRGGAGNLTTCASCGKPLGGRTVEAVNMFFHADCFKCQGCGKALVKTCINVKDKPHCDACARNTLGQAR